MPAAVPPRERIMTEASRVLARNRQASVEDIAIAAGVSRTTFYRAFPSRAQLLRAIEVQPEPDTRQRVLDASIRMLRTQTLKELSMDALATEAGVSRANLYRLFPGKSALFKAILLAYSPFEPVMAVFARASDHPPEEVIPEVVLTAYRTVAGHTGIVRTLLLEVTSMTPEFVQAFAETGLVAFGTFAQYLAGQMAMGRLRRIHPMVAVQSLVGGVMFHLLAAPVMSQGMVGVPSGEEVVLQFAHLWLRGMRPEATTRGN
jgi:TetR/AcrR family transcriptional repressor of mexJK operon